MILTVSEALNCDALLIPVILKSQDDITVAVPTDQFNLLRLFPMRIWVTIELVE